MKEELLAKLRAAGAIECELATADAVRLEYGRPRHGVEFSDQHLVHEAQLLSHISFTKGCYLGQEIVERVRSRGNVNRLLVRVVADTSEAPSADSPVMVGEKEAGAVKSAAYSPAIGKSIAFALVRAEFVKPETTFRVNEAEATLAASGRLG
jgi:aminomethyltransferase